jgi:hypothetical protein|uniref:Uncharacterized protein n=1 Tax=viral metagenome TaxID=1070528 RepID=A0A6C0I4W7_9ZZZZ
MEGDKISTLPTNENEKLQEPEQHLLDILLQDKKEDIKEIKNVSFAFKEAILGGLLFLLLSHSSFDNIVRMSGCKSELTVLLVKFAIFVILYFILQNKFINVKKN